MAKRKVLCGVCTEGGICVDSVEIVDKKAHICDKLK